MIIILISFCKDSIIYLAGLSLHPIPIEWGLHCCPLHLLTATLCVQSLQYRKATNLKKRRDKGR